MKKLTLAFAMILASVTAQANSKIDAYSRVAQGHHSIDGEKEEVSQCRLQIIDSGHYINFYITPNQQDKGIGFLIYKDTLSATGSLNSPSLQSLRGQVTYDEKSQTLEYNAKMTGEAIGGGRTNIVIKISPDMGEVQSIKVKSGVNLSLSWQNDFKCHF